MAAYFLFTILKNPVHSYDIYHSLPAEKQFFKNRSMYQFLFWFVTAIYDPLGTNGQCFNIPFTSFETSNFNYKSSVSSLSRIYFKLLAISGSTCSKNYIVTFHCVIATAIATSNTPPYGIDFLNEIANNFPMKMCYYPIPIPFQPIINSRTMPP